MKTQKINKRNSEMKNTITKYFNNIKKTRGASLAEFAVVAAMMGTMATVAAPKFSGVGAGAEKQKTSSNMDLIAQAASNFYNMTATEEKKGRFPGQDKYTDPVGTYGAAGSSLAEIQAAKDAIEADIELFNSYTSAKGAGFVSVFGLAHEDAPILPANVGSHSVAADDAGGKAYEQGLRILTVEVKGPGSGRETALRAFQSKGFKITSIKDTTPMPHNGTRPPKRRRV
jgi:ribosomal protein S11/Tfp pilus assembly protein PilE